MNKLEDLIGQLSKKKKSKKDLIKESTESGLIIVDMLKGFCETGPLQSSHNFAIAKPIAELVEEWQGSIVSLEDFHEEDDEEFKAFPPHCIKNSEEAEVVEPISSALKTKGGYDVVKKRTLSPFFGAWGYEDWLTKQKDRGLEKYYIVGNCTDLCIYQTALGTKMWFAEKKFSAYVNVIVDMVDTYDLPISEAPEGVKPHPRGVINQVFLYHMSLNGINLLELDN